ncbi:hypothetical protein B0O80DRAFT_502290 [Mortierella sp. GBAus27b]|nr:hypothetical protein BGX31_010402 [Mortierella sp. GBA43]KAI8348162.1 hypothetical protein B0O80DRAFT_502290 [Mortierella sp. GBAus27b]
MHPITPLPPLPEILSNIAKFIPRRRRPAYLLVSKIWYQVFIRLVWQDVNVRRWKQPTETLQSHAHLIKTLRINPEHGKNASLIFPNVQSLTLDADKFFEKQHQELLSHHTGIRRLRMVVIDAYPEFELWKKLQTGFTQLRELEFLNLQIGDMMGIPVDPFLQLCTRLEFLSIGAAMLCE